MTGAAGSDPVASVDDVLITAELASRPSRAPDYEAESRALGLLAQEMAHNPRGVLQKCADLVMELCHAESAGISILEPGGTRDVLRWHAVAGEFAPHLHGVMPREASPCGTVMERNCVLLFHEAERFFPALRGVGPRIYENLLAPWHVQGEAVGTLWAISHTPDGRFDAEDARVLQNLARFAAAAFQMTSALDEATAERSALRESEAHAQLLAREVDHRANNLLTVIQSVVGFSRAETADALREVILGRIHAIARAHRLLADSRFVGASLHRLATEELSPHGLGDPERIRIDGPDVMLSPNLAQNLSMLLHELATNAVKYGALSRSGGAVLVSWEADGDRLSRLIWQERGGPLVTPPRRQGSGSSLLRRALVSHQGRVSLDWRPEGLVCELSFTQA